MTENPTCTNCILGTQRDPSRASPFMGDLEDGWNDWKRLLIEKERGSLAQHGLHNERRQRGGGGERESGRQRERECVRERQRETQRERERDRESKRLKSAKKIFTLRTTKRTRQTTCEKQNVG